MTMTVPFENVLAEFSEERRRRIKARAQKLLAEYDETLQQEAAQTAAETAPKAHPE